MPGEGGSCTYVKAWVCDPLSFARIGVQLQGPRLNNPYPQAKNGSSNLHTAVVDKTMARIDIPHGLTVKIAASVNAFVIYSPSVGKVWILSGKSVGSHEGKQRMHNSGCRESVRCAGEQANEGIFSGETPHCWGGQCHREETESYLCLIKCAIVDCNGPVYALHLSRQLLFLGQSGGLRVWRLRPLLKGFNRLRRKAVKKENFCCPDSNKEDCIGNTGEEMAGAKVGDCIEFGKKKTVKEQTSDGWLNTTRSNGNMQHGNREAGQKNGLIQRFCDVEGVGNNAKVGLNLGVCAVLFAGDKSLTCQRGGVLEMEDDGGSRDDYLKGNPQEVLVKKCSGKGMNVDRQRKGVIALQANGIAEVHDQFISASNGPMQGLVLGCASKMAGPQGKNGLLCHNFHGPEDLPSQHQFSQSSTVSSSSSVFVPVSSPTGYALPGASYLASSLTSYGSSCCSLSFATTVSFPSMHGTFDNADPVKNHVEGVIRDEIMAGSFFVPFNNRNNIVDAAKKAKPAHAVCIQPVSERCFVVLDSFEKLHLLTLRHYSVPENGQKELKGIAFVGEACIRPLNCPMRVKLFAVLPSARQNAAVGAPSVPSKLWISDGSHSLYILSLPELHVPEEERDNCVEDDPKLTVNQVVFTAERIHALTAMLDTTMVVLTEGSILAYSMAGT